MEVGPKTRLGGRLRARRLSFESSPSTDTRTLEAFYDREFQRDLSIAVAVGVVATANDDSESTDPKVDASVTRTFGRGSSVVAGLRQDVSSSTGVSGATVDRGIYVSYRPSIRDERTEVRATAYYWLRRSALAATEPFETTTLETAESFGWRPRAGSFAVGAFHSYHDQNDLAGTSPGLATSYHSGGVYFRWEFQGAQGGRL